ncbi:MAG: alpha/beta fold hydrolase [Geodermatophilaceae bacterium]|nr:alpha/beta fold hydrolase [Geodermatophilaceae bacterium]
MIRRHRLLALIPIGLLLSGCIAAEVVGVDSANGSADRVRPGPPRFVVVSEQDCPDITDFECVRLSVPRDHFSDDDTEWEVTFAIRRAEGAAKGTFVTVTGGPGSSGLASAEGYTDAMPPGITDNYDIVFFDQRGIGDSQPVRCDEATGRYYDTTADVWDPDQRTQVIDDAQTFVDDCVAESGVSEQDMTYYSTAQAIEDLEAFRAYLGADQLSLYGESYGTQYVQTYAAAHPKRVASLIVDGVVDLSTEIIPYYIESAQAYGDTVNATLDACDRASVCAEDAPGDAIRAYNDLAAELDEGPIVYEFPLPDGTLESREFTEDDLFSAASGFASGLGVRMQLQRAVNSAAEGNLVPLARLAHSARAQDAETYEPEIDAAFSDAMFFAVECQDYSYLPDLGSPRERLDAWVAAAQAAGLDEEPLGGIAFGDLPCLVWPSTSDIVERPAPITEAAYPVFVLNSNTDPNTPADNAMRVFSRFTESYLVLLDGGPHVIFGWGYRCVDDLIGDFLGDGELPVSRITLCDGAVADPYVPNTPATEAEYVDVVTTVSAIEDSVFNNVEYNDWYGDSVLEMGCDLGGTLTYDPISGGAELTFSACEFSDGVPVDGTGELRFSGTTTVDVVLPFADLISDGAGTITGTFRGQPVA